jgi:hypothetical protein
MIKRLIVGIILAFFVAMITHSFIAVLLFSILFRVCITAISKRRDKKIGITHLSNTPKEIHTVNGKVESAVNIIEE